MDVKEFREKCALAVLGAILSTLGCIALLTLYLLFAGKLSAAEAEPTKWDRWNVAPYASSQEEACKKAPAAINGFSLPPAVREHFKQTLGTTCAGGTEVWLTPGMFFMQMWSGGAKPHVMNNKTVGELPVLKSPDGRAYRSGSVAETPKALRWTFVHEGKAYDLYLPFVCFNWSWGYVSIPTVAANEKCVELSFNAFAGGQARWAAATTTGPLPLSLCNAQREGNGKWLPWHGQCDTCPFAIEYMRGVLGNSAQMPHRHLYPIGEPKQTLRFSASVREAVISICLEDAKGRRTCGVYMRPQDWKGRTNVEIPDSLWVWDDDKCPE